MDCMTTRFRTSCSIDKSTPVKIIQIDAHTRSFPGLPLCYPTQLVSDNNASRLFIADGPEGKIYCIETCGNNAAIFLYAGGEPGFADGLSHQARFCVPYDLQLGPTGDLYVCDIDSHRIRCIRENNSLGGRSVSTFAGSSPGYLDGPRNEAHFLKPAGLLYLPELDEWLVADSGNRLIRRMSQNVTTLTRSTMPFQSAGVVSSPGLLSCPAGVYRDHKSIIVIDPPNGCLRRISRTGMMNTMSGLMELDRTPAKLMGISRAAVNQDGSIFALISDPNDEHACSQLRLIRDDNFVLTVVSHSTLSGLHISPNGCLYTTVVRDPSGALDTPAVLEIQMPILPIPTVSSTAAFHTLQNDFLTLFTDSNFFSGDLNLGTCPQRNKLMRKYILSTKST